MKKSIIGLQTGLMKEYYRYFSKYAKGRTPENKVAWVTAFTPVEILEALDMIYYYPESYAAVIAASGKEQELIRNSERSDLSRDCCSYSCCFNGCLDNEDAPRGTPPEPDVLIATNNQCDTLPNWWNVLAVKYDVPLIVIDYPGENMQRGDAFSYVTGQHRSLISKLEKLTGNKLDEDRLSGMIENSSLSVEKWKKVISYLPQKDINPASFFDDISFLITSRCRTETAELYDLMAESLENTENADDDRIRTFWLGYPLWYHKDRILSECLDDFRITGSNYITWWNLDYSGSDAYEKLFSAYNYTFLNLSRESRDERLRELIRASKAECAVVLHNKSCKCDLVSARNIELLQAELDIDMIDREYLNVDRAKTQMEILKETLCTG